MADSERNKLDFIFSVHGPGIKEASLAAKRFKASYEKEHGRRIVGGHAPIGRYSPDYADISLIKDRNKLPDVVGGMGFGEYIDKVFTARYVDTDCFKGITYPRAAISLFDGIKLSDNKCAYHIYGGSAFVMLVDERKLGGAPMPQCWDDLLKPCYRDKIVCGFNIDDINEIFLIYLFKDHGDDGLRAFAENLVKPIDTLDMMRTSLIQQNNNAIYLMPHFFACSAPKESYLHIVWPDEGALFVPYYFLTQNKNEELDKAIINFFLSDDLASALTKMNLFHIYSQLGSVDPARGFSERSLYGARDRTFKWLGWDWLLKQDIIKLMKHIDSIVTPIVLSKNPMLRKDIGKALWNG
ncbi:MAG: ABC transporter substrate-binding protein [Eggerthellaceae bacterium]|jgi:ABC-type Fe3+ transport system substrate-binding protein|nr:ABC transporter substrate-binding protein [Eggerthellaceae bacterium]MCH4220430.1 ABC transporter substrate-binding protein [Eggerthellaceae bacterium]